jgi:hypothetical protein
MCNAPVGLGAKRTLTFLIKQFFSWKSLFYKEKLKLNLKCKNSKFYEHSEVLMLIIMQIKNPSNMSRGFLEYCNQLYFILDSKLHV